VPAGAPKAGGRRKGRPTARAARRLDLRTANFGKRSGRYRVAGTARSAVLTSRPELVLMIAGRYAVL